MFFADRATVKGTHRTSDGYLSAECRVARTGIQIYSGAEVGKPEKDMVRVYRSADEVFSAAAMASAAHKPITLDHPAEGVDASRWKQLAIGWTGGDVARDGEFLRVPMIVADAAAIAAIESGKKEISLGYRAEIHWGSGVTPASEQYDAVQKFVRINHCAIVASGRAGAMCRFGDNSLINDETFLFDNAGQPREFIDRDTWAPVRGINAAMISAIRAEAQKAGVTVQNYVTEHLRYRIK